MKLQTLPCSQRHLAGAGQSVSSQLLRQRSRQFPMEWDEAEPRNCWKSPATQGEASLVIQAASGHFGRGQHLGREPC